MTSDLAGEIRCPSCGRTTPLAPFCTHCGSVIPEGAAARPRAMSREELEERIRGRRALDSPFRRGAPEVSTAGQAWTPPRRPQAFVPEPADGLAREVRPLEDEPPRIDYFDDRRGTGSSSASPDREALIRGTGGIPGAALPPSAANWPPRDLDEPPPGASAPPPMGAQPVAQAWTATPDRALGDSAANATGQPGGGYADRGYGEDDYTDGGYGGDSYADGRDHWDDEEPQRRRSGMLAVIGFVILGIAALLGGGFLFSALNSSATVAEQTATPSPTATQSAAESGTASPSGSVSQGASRTPGTTTTPVPQPDNFTAEARPCATAKMGFDGCDVDGTALDRGQVWVWVGFKNGQASDVIGVTIVSKESGSPVQDGSLELDRLTGCDPDKPCSGGYINVSFAGLDPGAYTIQVTRDGDQVATSAFTVND